mmetsp:Transcript_21299/g.59430  ORF Transcript_21299/g.59430 Transcript_21299/m.59430 type:complete len:283 (+) Transcript_21299:1894-2742(+)
MLLPYTNGVLDLQAVLLFPNEDVEDKRSRFGAVADEHVILVGAVAEIDDTTPRIQSLPSRGESDAEAGSQAHVAEARAQVLVILAIAAELAAGELNHGRDCRIKTHGRAVPLYDCVPRLQALDRSMEHAVLVRVRLPNQQRMPATSQRRLGVAVFADQVAVLVHAHVALLRRRAKVSRGLANFYESWYFHDVWTLVRTYAEQERASLVIVTGPYVAVLLLVAEVEDLAATPETFPTSNEGDAEARAENDVTKFLGQVIVVCVHASERTAWIGDQRLQFRCRI